MYHQLTAAGLDDITALAHVSIPLDGAGKLDHTPAFKSWLSEYTNDDSDQDGSDDSDEDNNEDPNNEIIYIGYSHEEPKHDGNNNNKRRDPPSGTYSNQIVPQHPCERFQTTDLGTVEFVHIQQKHTRLDNYHHDLLLSDIRQTISEYRMRESMAPIDELVVYVSSLVTVLNNSTTCSEYVG